MWQVRRSGLRAGATGTATASKLLRGPCSGGFAGSKAGGTLKVSGAPIDAGERAGLQVASSCPKGGHQPGKVQSWRARCSTAHRQEDEGLRPPYSRPAGVARRVQVQARGAPTARATFAATRSSGDGRTIRPRNRDGQPWSLECACASASALVQVVRMWCAQAPPACMRRC